MSTIPAQKPRGGASLTSAIKANQKPLLAGAAGLVALVAYLRTRGAGTGSEGGGGYVAPTFAGQTVGGPAYDSSANDVYNAIQPQLEQTQNLIGKASEENKSLFDKLTDGLKKATDAAAAATKAATSATTASQSATKAASSATTAASTATKASQAATTAATKATAAATAPRVPTPAPPVKAAPTPARTAPKPAPVKAPATTTYVVKKGDNLSAIGARYGVSWNSIYAANRGVIGSNPNLILPGQKLVIKK